MKLLNQKNGWHYLVCLFLLTGFYFIYPPKAFAAAIAVTGKAKVLNTANSYLDFTNYNSNATVDDGTGNFSGYAFLEDMGWVDFGSTDNPSGPVNLNLTNGVVTGKAYILNTAAYLDFDNYNSNVTVALATGVFSGYVFSEDMGWIDFSDTGVLSSSPFLPTAPSGLSGTADSSTTITWSWTDNASNETGFKLYDDSDNLIAIITTANTESYQETGLTRGTTYTRYVVAYNGVGNSSNSANTSAATNTSQPDSFDLKEPGNNDYTNSERPTFKWEDSADSDDGLSKYKLEIDNGDSDDFTIDDIPVSRTTDYEINKYLIRFENFDDSDNTNNYISVYTKSSSDWGSSENDGKLKEGKRTWKVKAVDNAGNEKEESRTLFVDRSGSEVEATQVNETAFADNLATTDKTPTIFGKTTDSLAGDLLASSGQVNKVASGPKEIKINISKKNYLGLHDLHTLSTVNLTENYWTSDGSKITDNSKNTSHKYSTFEYTPSIDLPLGNYQITLTGKDKAGNEGSLISFNLTITTLAEMVTPEEEKIIEEIIKEERPDITPEEKEKLKEELEIVKEVEAKKPSFFQKTITGMASAIKNIYWKTVGGAKLMAVKTSKTVQGLLAFRKQKIKEAQIAFAKNYFNLSQKAPGVIKDRLLALAGSIEVFNETIGKASNKLAVAWRNAKGSIRMPASKETQALATRLRVATSTFIAIVFDKEATKILFVKIEKVSPTSAMIVWGTNHYATSVVNYGFNTSYGKKIQSDKRVKEHRIKLTDLEPGKLYYFEVMSQNKNYVYDAYYTFNTPEKEEEKVKGAFTEKRLVTITADEGSWVVVRNEPSLKGEVLAKVAVGQSFPLLEKKDGWAKIKLNPSINLDSTSSLQAGQVEGWVFGELVKSGD